MATVINLRQARKAKQRADKERQAEENRRKHGMTKAERETIKDDQDRATRHLDGHKKSDDQDTGDDDSGAD